MPKYPQWDTHVRNTFYSSTLLSAIVTLLNTNALPHQILIRISSKQEYY
ncbi:hypothetical protein [Candidatus Erwinia haradaeae]|nr:hypothetical protein [Candidatus Erwinia haradaeae]